MKDVFVSVVIPASGKGSPVGPCLEKVLKQNYEKKEVIVACDAEAEQTLDIPANSAGVRVIRQKGRAEFAHLLNSGMRAARGAVRVLLMPECIPAGQNWLEQMVKPFEEEDVGVVVSQCRIREKKQMGLHERFINAVANVERINKKGRPVEQQLVSHLCDAYRASALAEFGYFEEDVFARPGEAVDASLKTADAGYSIVLSPEATVFYRPPDRQRHLRGALAQGLDYGYSDAALSRLYRLERFNSRVSAVALFSLVLIPLGFVSLPVAVILALAIFAWGWFTSVRLPPVPWEWPLGLFNLALYVAIILAIRDGWASWLFGRAMHPAIIRQWCLLAATTGCYLLIIVSAAFVCAVRSVVRDGGVFYSVPILLLAVPWRLMTGVGFLKGVVVGYLKRH